MTLEGIKILLVEDNPGDARLFLELVHSASAGADRPKVEHASRLALALDVLSHESVDVVILDLSLPDEQGLATLTRLHGHSPNIPIVVLTGLDDEALAVKALRAGAQDYLVKGRVDGDLLLRSLRYATERGRALQALERREEHYRSLIENSLDLVSILNFDGTIRYASPSHERVLGYTLDELVGQNAFSFVHPDDLGAVRDAFTKSDGSATLESRFRHKDGSWRVLESFGRNLAHVPGVSGVVVNTRDITDRKRLEEQLHHSQRLEAVGRLAGGVAHDFNNLLMVITGYSEMLWDNLHPGDPGRDDLEQIVKAARRATDLTHQLLAFSRRQPARPEVVNMNLLVADMERMLRRVMGEDIELVTSLSPELAAVEADPGQIEQVILNIAVNARDAMPNGGEFRIETARLKPPGETSSEDASREYVTLAMKDTGVGMDPRVMSRVFEPFFTTKEHGSGLGLSTSYGIIKQSGGDIRVESKPGRGTVFRIFLPAAERPQDSRVASPEKAADGNETILLVEDEEGVRHVVEAMLKRHGYHVLSSASSADAINLVEGQNSEIDLLITDIVMPGMSGKKMAEAMLSRCPDMKVLFVSGYGDSQESELTAPFLQKPFTSEELAWKIREVLRGA